MREEEIETIGGSVTDVTVYGGRVTHVTVSAHFYSESFQYPNMAFVTPSSSLPFPSLISRFLHLIIGLLYTSTLAEMHRITLSSPNS